MGISSHILDTTKGKPAVGVALTLEKQHGAAWTLVGSGITDADGRVKSLVAVPEVGTYRITFDVAAYFAAQNTDAFYPTVSIVFVVRNASEHFHVPLLLNPFGYATYRGS